MSEKSFEEFLRTTALPSTAEKHLPEALSGRTQAELLRRADAEKVIESAIEEIDKGSVEAIEKLVLKKLNAIL